MPCPIVSRKEKGGLGWILNWWGTEVIPRPARHKKTNSFFKRWREKKPFTMSIYQAELDATGADAGTVTDNSETRWPVTSIGSMTKDPTSFHLMKEFLGSREEQGFNIETTENIRRQLFVLKKPKEKLQS